MDDGTYYNYELKDYRTRLVTEISKYRNANGRKNNHFYFDFYSRISVPMVTLVVEGGPDTLSAIYNDLHNDIPVVLIDVRRFCSKGLSSYINLSRE